MLKLIPSSDRTLILSFMKGSGILRKLAGGYDLDGMDVQRAVNESQDVFLVALDKDNPRGFISFRPEGKSIFSVHLCLKTIGEKTRAFFDLALKFAKERLGAATILAAYPESYRAVKILLSEFKFQDEAPWMLTPVPYSFKTLTL